MSTRCNGNEIADPCDIEGTTSTDCNQNGIPDECEPGWDQDCNGNKEADLCDIFGTVSTDCNANHVPDECDLAGLTSEDCTKNGVPDECERDCNANGIADSCDVADGTSEDRNADGIPDECTLRFSLVPVRATGEYQIRGNEITVEYGGQRMIFDLYLSGWDPDLDGDPRLRIYQAAIEFSTFTSGDRGYLKLANTIPCTNNDDCLGDSLCEDTGFCDEYGAVNIDKRRPNFVFAGLDAIVIPAIRPTEVLYGALLWDGAVVAPGATFPQRRPTGGALSTCDGRDLLCAANRVSVEGGANDLVATFDRNGLSGLTNDALVWFRNTRRPPR